jgi:hypothetical protein
MQVKDRRWPSGVEHGLLAHGGKRSDALSHVPNFRVARNSGQMAHADRQESHPQSALAQEPFIEFCLSGCAAAFNILPSAGATEVHGATQ